jgi:beta-phosphoglucomutase
VSHHKAVIFDVDGVLVDSYDAHFRSWQALGREVGVEFSEQQFAATFGRTSRDIIQACFSSGGQPPSDERIAELDDRKEALYRQLVDADFPAMPGAVALIDAARAGGFSLAVASSGPPQNIDLALRRLERADAFSAVVTGLDVTSGKPDPQVFELAAQRLGIEPQHCVVIEDAPAGILAAHRAGMAAVALLSTGRQEPDFVEAAPRLIVSSLAELSPQGLEGLIEGRGREA